MVPSMLVLWRRVGIGVASLLLGCAGEEPVSRATRAVVSADIEVDGIVYEDVTAEFDIPDASRFDTSTNAKQGGETFIPRLHEVELPEGGKLPALADLTLEELAYGLRDVISIDGKVYREKELDWERARKIKAGEPKVIEAYPGPETDDPFGQSSGETPPADPVESRARPGSENPLDKDAEYIWNAPGVVGTDDNLCLWLLCRVSDAARSSRSERFDLVHTLLGQHGRFISQFERTPARLA